MPQPQHAVLVRWEKKAENHLALIHLACAQLIFFAKRGFMGVLPALVRCAPRHPITT